MATGVEPVADSFALAPLGGGGGVDEVEGTLEDGLDTAGGGPRDQADVLGAEDWEAVLLGGVEALLICVRILVNGECRVALREEVEWGTGVEERRGQSGTPRRERQMSWERRRPLERGWSRSGYLW